MVLEAVFAALCLCQSRRLDAQHQATFIQRKRECKLPVMMTDGYLAFSELIGLLAALPPSKIIHPQLPASDSPIDWCENVNIEM